MDPFCRFARGCGGGSSEDSGGVGGCPSKSFNASWPFSHCISCSKGTCSWTRQLAAASAKGIDNCRGVCVQGVLL